MEETTSYKVLAVIIDNNLSCCHHFAYSYKVILVKVFQLSKIKHFLNLCARKPFSMLTLHALNMEQHCGTWLNFGSNLRPLVSLRRNALKLILLKSAPLMDEDYKIVYSSTETR